MTHAEKEIRNEAMRLYKAEGHTNQEVAEKFNLTETTANLICKGIAPQRSHKPPKNKGVLKDEKEVAKDIEQRQGGFLYAGNYTGTDGTVDLKCKECGTISTRSMITIRHNNVRCRECERRAKERQEANKSLLKWFDELVADIQREENAIAKQEREQAKYHPCEVCGRQTKHKYTCSTKCSEKRNNQRKEDKRRIKIANALVDADITLESLYRRDNGVCALCGGLCDWDDYVWRDGNKIAGNYYPSKDHIIPLAKGGEHSWDNIQLAHRICNSLKADEVSA